MAPCRDWRGGGGSLFPAIPENGHRLLHQPMAVATALIAMLGTGLYTVADAQAMHLVENTGDGNDLIAAGVEIDLRKHRMN